MRKKASKAKSYQDQSKLSLGFALLLLGAILVFGNNKSYADKRKYTFAEEPIKIEGFESYDSEEEKLPQAILIPELRINLEVKKAALVSFPFMFCPFILIPFMINIGFIGSYFWPLTFFMFASCFIFYLMVKGDTESKTLENIHAWSVMYAEYIFFALGFALLTIFSNSLDFIEVI